MKDTASSAVKVSYYSSCLGGGPPKLTNKCDGLKVSMSLKISKKPMLSFAYCIVFYATKTSCSYFQVRTRCITR